VLCTRRGQISSDLFRFLTPRFKKEFTQSQGQLLVVVAAPHGSEILQYTETVAAGPAEFLFTFDRCHLSESWNDYYETSMSTRDPTEPMFDLMGEFCFTGAFLVRGRGGNRYVPVEPHELRANLIHDVRELQQADQVGFVGGRIPAEWVKAAVDSDVFNTSKSELLPIPIWEADLD
jgi:hypothetical protein